MSPPTRRKRLSGWGRYPIADCLVAQVRRPEEAATIVANSSSLVARGCGRSYGDSALNRNLVVETGKLDRVLEFDGATGLLACEAGISLEALLAIFLPRGWIAPVTPGTKFVTVGGMISADVHGKNHHRDGSFCDFVEWVDVALPDGRVERCARDCNADLFAAVCGGMGLAGLILRAAFRMKRVETAVMRQRTRIAANVDEAIDLFEASLEWTYSVGWIDCLAKGSSLGRSIVFLAEHALQDELGAAAKNRPLALRIPRAKTVPIDFPRFALGPVSVRMFNAAYFRTHRSGDRNVDLDAYYYPLDRLRHWNRIYGKRGFVQYQCVLPLGKSREGIVRLLEAISAAGIGSFLAVLKRMGKQSFGLLSFPQEGYTLALDFPVSASSLKLLRSLDDIVLRYGGRLYLAKDARADPQMMAEGYPRLGEFREVRRRWGLDLRFQSLQSQRLEI